MQAAYDKQRGSAHARGYDAQWAKVRAMKLRRKPMCEDCGEAEATQVHHKVAFRNRPGLRLRLDNLMSLCASCHSRRTAQEQGGKT